MMAWEPEPRILSSEGVWNTYKSVWNLSSSYLWRNVKMKGSIDWTYLDGKKQLGLIYTKIHGFHNWPRVWVPVPYLRRRDFKKITVKNFPVLLWMGYWRVFRFRLLIKIWNDTSEWSLERSAKAVNFWL